METPARAMTNPAGDSPGEEPVSAVPYAVLVPVLVVMAQSAWVAARGWGLRNTLLAAAFHPIVLSGMVVVVVISFFVIRPFAGRATGRWVALLACVLGFTALVEPLLPKISE